LFEASAGGVLPLGFGGERFVGPCGVGGCVVAGDVDDGVVEAILDVRAGAFGVFPGRAGDFAPPGRGGDGVVDEFVEAVGGKVHPEDEGPAEVFGFGEIVRGFDEGGKVAVGDGVGIDVEGCEYDGADGTFAVEGECVGVVGSHEEGSAGKGDGGAVCVGCGGRGESGRRDGLMLRCGLCGARCAAGWLGCVEVLNLLRGGVVIHGGGTILCEGRLLRRLDAGLGDRALYGTAYAFLSLDTEREVVVIR
jgi:hypothetical protein